VDRFGHAADPIVAQLADFLVKPSDLFLVRGRERTS
jgi:hypothetical protein